MRILALFALAIAAFDVFAANLAFKPVPRDSDPNGWWMKRHESRLKLAEAGGGDVVFIGDSITHGWESSGRRQWDNYFTNMPYRAINLGYSGDRTEHVLWRIENGELDGYKAKAVVLMIGTNNGGANPIMDTILGIREIILRIREKQPQAKIILHPIFPRGETRDSNRRVVNAAVNREICKYADNQNVFWVDFTDRFLTADGKILPDIMPDFLHPRAYGYELWAAAVLPYLNYVVQGDFKYRFPALYPSNVDPSVFPDRRGKLAVMPDTRVMEPNHRGIDWWAARMKAKRTQIAESRGEFDLVLFGDSITHFWEYAQGDAEYAEMTNRYDVLNIGYGGDQTQHLVWRGKYGELDGYKAKCISLMIGTNNRNPAQEIADGVRKVLDVIAEKQPQAKVLLTAIFPRGKNDDDERRKANVPVNKLIKEFADGKKVFWLDFNDKFLNADGTFKPDMMLRDNLHPSHAGYRVWLDAMMPYLKEFCGK